MLVSSQIRAMPSSFPSVPSHGLMVGTRGSPWQELPLCRFSDNGTPGHYTVSEPTSSLNRGVPFPVTPPQRSRGRLVPRAPSLRTRAQCTAHVAYGAPGPASAGHPCPLRYPDPPWALGLPRPTSPVPGVPTQRYSPFVATLPTRQQGSCTPPNRFRAYTPTNSKTTSILSI